jgi:predicted DNA-binding transcriptional regulator AlpA
MEGRRSIPTLLRLTPFQPGESLLSRLFRLAKINHCDSLYPLSSLISESSEQAEGTRDRLGRPGQRETYELLATLTRSKVEELYAATAHIFTPILAPPESPIPSLELRDSLFVPILESKFAHGHIYPECAGQFCPLCLQEEAAHCLRWLPTAITTCLRHHCFLVNKCLTCGKGLRITDIVSTHCGACAANLTQVREEPILMDDFGSFTQQVLQSWFLTDPAPIRGHAQLPEQPANVLYRVLTGLRLLLLGLPESAWPYLSEASPTSLRPSPTLHLQVRSPNERYYEYAAAFKVLVNWPQGFFDFLDVCRSQSDKGKLSKRRGDTEFGDIYTHWIQKYWKPPAFNFLQEAFDQYVFEKCGSSPWVRASRRYRAHPRLAQGFDLLGMTEAIELLGTSSQTVRSLLQTGQLTAYKDGQYQRLVFLNRREVLALCEKRNNRISITEVASLLGISQRMVHDLVEVGLLIPEQGPTKKTPKGLLTRSSLMACLEKIGMHVEIRPVGSGKDIGINLHGATQLAVTVGLSAAQVLLRVAEGHLRAYHHGSSQFQLNSLQFTRVDVQAWVDTIKAEKHWMGLEAVLAFLRVTSETYASWLQAGLLSPVAIVGHIKYFDRHSIEQFRSHYVQSEEAAHLLGIKVSCLYQWISSGWLDGLFFGGRLAQHRHSSYLFDRDRLLQWRTERLVSSEAAEFLGIRKEELFSLVRKGRLTPLAGTRTRPYWFLRQDIVAIQNENRDHPLDTMLSEPSSSAQ